MNGALWSDVQDRAAGGDLTSVLLISRRHAATCRGRVSIISAPGASGHATIVRFAALQISSDVDFHCSVREVSGVRLRPRHMLWLRVGRASRDD